MNLLFQKWLRRIGASLFFLGYIPLVPGTVGSAVTVLAIWFAYNRHPAFFDPSNAVPFWLMAVGLAALSIFLSNDSEGVFGKRDSGHIIIDECVGQFITFLMVPLSIRTCILGFALFRFFDIVKPFPVHLLEEIEDGAGVTMDDVAAGVLANITLHLTLWMYHVISTRLV